MEISKQIFGNSPTMLALCLTTVGLIKIYSALQRITTLADDFLMLCLTAFLAATLLSYLSLRSPDPKRKLVLAKVADIMFLSGLCVATVVAAFIVFTLAG